jgi:tRNA threonylcarbamoyladenosine biosynthesis protein TsaE
MEVLIRDKKEMDDFARTAVMAVLEHEKKNTEGATVLGLSGELGAGKTTFVQALARVLGVTESVTSPTFVIARFYPLPTSSLFTRLVHVDAYRIESLSELDPIGMDDIFRDPNNLVVVEWPEKIAPRLPLSVQYLRFAVVSETTRLVCGYAKD